MDSQQLRAQLERHHEEAYGWALNLCRYRTDDADNLLQTSYVNILSRPGTFAEHSSFQTWLFAVIRKTALELRRREWLHRLWLISDDKAEQQLDHRPRPEHLVHEAERSTRLRDAVARLPRRQSEVVHLVFYHELSIADAAGVMQVSLGSARRHYERAKLRLRQLLPEEERT